MTARSELLYELTVRRKRRNVRGYVGGRATSPAEVARIMHHVADDETREIFVTFALDVRNAIAGYEITAIGQINGVTIHPREVFRLAIVAGASSVVVAHNHPSGELNPSDDDWALTDRLKQAGELLGIPVLDHVIVTPDGHRSFMERGALRAA